MQGEQAMQVDLQAHRCPTAQVLMNRVLEKFVSSNDKELIIYSIEPSLHRNVLGRIAGLELPLKVQQVTSTKISNEDVQAWQENFDDDDYGDVQNVVTITLCKAG